MYNIMELWIPSQSLDVKKIHMCDFINEDKYSIAPLEYYDGNLTLKNVTIMTPPLVVSYYDRDTGKLQFDLADYQQFATKMNSFQSHIVGVLAAHQRRLFGIAVEYTSELIESMIQYIVYKNKMTLYTGSNKTITLFECDNENRGPLKIGDKIRCAVQIKGISCIWNFNTGMPRLRFQHSLKAAYRVA
jgi:hypothetical protein